MPGTALLGLVAVVATLLGGQAAAAVEWSLGIQVPGVSIGINVPRYPRLVQVPGYPVYYAPEMRSNYFFYDGMYWIYQEDSWYASTWYNGPWRQAAPEGVPPFLLRVPVRYYRNPPPYFRPWRVEAAPRWGEHWGPAWQAQRSGWERPDRVSLPRAAPLPRYQRDFPEGRYPPPERQQDLHDQNYRYAPREQGRPPRTEQPAPETARDPSRDHAAPPRQQAEPEPRFQGRAQEPARNNPSSDAARGPAHEPSPGPSQEPSRRPDSPRGERGHERERGG
jgi:hypothetical protein